MHRETVRRGIAALTLAVALVLAGALPAAAAQEPGPFSRSLGWLAGFWGGVVEKSGFGEGMSSLLSLWGAATQEESEKGLGVDPNGNCNDLTIGGGETLPGDNY